MNDRRECVSGGEIDVCSTGGVRCQLRETDKSFPRVEDVSTSSGRDRSSARARTGRARGGAAPSEWMNASEVCCARDLVVRPKKIIDAEFFILVQSQFSDHRAKRDLRRFHVHFIENFFTFTTTSRLPSTMMAFAR